MEFYLFIVFFQIGLFSIGGGYAIIPLIQEQVVENHGWITEGMFTDIITISQMTPGPLAVNTSTFAGLQIGGVAGAIGATTGCVLAGIIISLGLYHFIRRKGESHYITGLLSGLKSTSLGLIGSAAGIIILLMITGSSVLGGAKSVDWMAIVIFGVIFGVLRKTKMNPMILMALCGGLGMLIYG